MRADGFALEGAGAGVWDYDADSTQVFYSPGWKQMLGYAEADPSFDVDGHDTAQKLAILASLAFGTKVAQNAVYVEGISSIAPEDLAPVHAPADVCAKLAAAALVVGAYSSADPQAALRQIIELGEAAVIGN